ncbi:cell wall-binding repeat-containing protein [Sutcliffiella halmapala]|uniref:cell wall-binding repeat-containing protein n=1 Tax=Sutcliffiella halmapala TaxID=79882 RepID=UPI000994FB35|nr:cell wall-binding repeat-containing protein [Sutcliffiella halmapala]
MVKRKVLVSLIVLVGLWLIPTFVQAAERVSGSDRYSTAVEISKAGWAVTQTVIIARGDNFPDALAGGPLAYYYDAPILLTSKNSLNAVTKKEIERLKATHAIILGGEGAISKGVVEQIKKMNLSVERIGGSGRYETAALIAKQIPHDEVVIANGLNFPDALAVAPYASRNGIPILLTEVKTLPAVTKNIADKSKKQYIIGGNAVVHSTVASKFANPVRLAGSDRFSTTKTIIEKLPLDNHRAYVATGNNFADALTGSVLAAKNNAPILLVSTDRIPTPIQSIINEFSTFSVLGGNAVVNNAVVKELEKIEQVNGIVVNFKDNGLKMMVADTLGIPYEAKEKGDTIELVHIEREITSLDMLKLETLGNQTRYYDFFVRNLEGLQYAKNLHSLEVQQNASDFAPLKGLTKLKRLDLSSYYNYNHEHVHDLSALSSFSQLDTLFLANLNLKNNTRFLENLTQLKTVSLSNTNIKDISNLGKLVNISDLDLSENSISDVRPLSNLSKLEYLSVDINEISDISSLKGLKKLESLNLGYNNIKDFSVVGNFKNLQSLALHNNPLEKGFAELGTLSALKHLHFQQNGLSDISFLAPLTNLERLSMTNDSITDISVLQNHTKLSLLNLTYNHIEDISPLVKNAQNRSSIGPGINFFIAMNKLDLSTGSKATHAIEELKKLGINVY